MMKKRIVSILLFFGILELGLGQQSQLYTQFGFNKLALNPAYAGNHAYHSFTGIYRDQWNGFPGAPNAQMVTADLARFGNRVGLGFTFERQTIGISRQINIVSNYAYKIPMESGTLSGGLSASIKNLVNDFTDSRLVALQDINQDQALDVARLSKSVLNVGAGIYFNNDYFFAGIAIPALIKNDIALGENDHDDVVSREVRHLFLMGGGTWQLNERLDFRPQLLLRWVEGGPLSFDLNLGLLYNTKYHTSLTYRSGGSTVNFGDSIDFMFGLQVTDQILLGFAYDFTVSELRKYVNGSLEFLFKYRLIKTDKEQIKMANPRYF